MEFTQEKNGVKAPAVGSKILVVWPQRVVLAGGRRVELPRGEYLVGQIKSPADELLLRFLRSEPECFYLTLYRMREGTQYCVLLADLGQPKSYFDWGGVELVTPPDEEVRQRWGM